jgi:hypothetical protein
MIKLIVSLAATVALAWPVAATAQGGGRHAGPPAGAKPGGHRGGAGWHGGKPVAKPGWGGRYPGGGYVGYRGYGGPRVGFYYGAPAYWGRPYAWGAWPVWGAAIAYPFAYPYGYPSAYGSAPVVVTTTPQTYIQQDADISALWSPAPAAPPEPQYWYYCVQPAGYFPYVKDCSQPWLKVVPQAPGEPAPRLAP